MHNLSLIGFTLLIQICVGVFGTTLFNIWISKNGILHIPFITLSVCLGLIVLGLIFAMAHLGNPKNAPYALSNITRSWLSREIVSINLLASCIGLLWGMTWLGVLNGLFFIEIATLISGIFAVWTMSKVYALRTVPVWNHLSTPIDFFGTALISGGIASATLNLIIPDHMSIPGVTFLIFSCLGLVCKIISISLKISIQQHSKTKFWYASSRAKSSGHASTYVVLLFLYTLGFFVFVAANNGRVENQLPLLLLSLSINLLTEIWNRFRFYDSFCRLGL